MILNEILKLLNTLLEKIPFVHLYFERRKLRRKFDIEYAKEILAIFTYNQFDIWINHIVNGFVVDDEVYRIWDLQQLTNQKRFFKKKIQNKLEEFMQEVGEFKNWSANVFFPDPNSSKMKIEKYTTAGELMEDYSMNMEKTIKYANRLFEKYTKFYFKVQREYPKVFQKT